MLSRPIQDAQLPHCRAVSILWWRGNLWPNSGFSAYRLLWHEWNETDRNELNIVSNLAQELGYNMGSWHIRRWLSIYGTTCSKYSTHRPAMISLKAMIVKPTTKKIRTIRQLVRSQCFRRVIWNMWQRVQMSEVQSEKRNRGQIIPWNSPNACGISVALHKQYINRWVNENKTNVHKEHYPRAFHLASTSSRSSGLEFLKSSALCRTRMRMISAFNF